MNVFIKYLYINLLYYFKIESLQNKTLFDNIKLGKELITMINNKFMDTLNSLVENPEKVSMAQLESILIETLKFFDSIRGKLTSEDLDVRSKAMDEAAEMQDKLNQIADKMYEKTGLTKEKAAQILSNPSNFKSEDWETMKNMEKELGYFQKGL